MKTDTQGNNTRAFVLHYGNIAKADAKIISPRPLTTSDHSLSNPQVFDYLGVGNQENDGGETQKFNLPSPSTLY